MNRRLATVAAALVLVLPAACGTGPDDEGGSAAPAESATPSGGDSGNWSIGSGGEDSLPSTSEEPAMSGSLEELLVAPSAMPELTYLIDESGATTEQPAEVPPEDQPRTEPAECAPKPASEQRETAKNTFVDESRDYWYSVYMLGRDVGLSKVDDNISKCPEYTTFYPDKEIRTQVTPIDGPQVEGVDVRANDMTTTTISKDGAEHRLNSSAYMAEVRGVTFFVQLTVHNEGEIGPENRRLMDKLFEAQVRQLRGAG